MNLTTMLTRSLRTAAYAAAVPLLLACGSRAGSINADSSAAAEPAGGAITLWTDSTELFMEHPALVVGAPGKFAVHLTDLTDFAPLRSGRITLRFVPRTSSAGVGLRVGNLRRPLVPKRQNRSPWPLSELW